MRHSITVRRATLPLLVALAICFGAVTPAYAYIGPGAGFAFIGSTFVFLLTGVMAVLTLLFWPIQWAVRVIRGRGISKHARAQRVVILGLDGLEPTLVERFMSEGKLPNFTRLKQQGGYSRLGTTLPALSPVAWSSFQTGVNPGAHNIFDFLTRDKRYCLPELSSTRTESGRVFRLGPIEIPLGGPRTLIARRSQPFWKILGKHGVFSTVLRVPISYPPEPFEGLILSAMCTPDLRGTQGSFTFYSTRKQRETQEGGEFVNVRVEGDLISAELAGPKDPKSKEDRVLRCPFKLRLNRQDNSAELSIGDKSCKLELNRFSDWIEIPFKFGWNKKIFGICRFCLRELSEEVGLYVSPINVHPEMPALSISHPLYFSRWIAKANGLFGTLGLMEDTWGRNEFVLDDRRFLDQAYLTHAEREKMFFKALEKTRRGTCICVFDASDRIQHMFWRYMDPKHPAPREGSEFDQTIPEMYAKMDALLGRTLDSIKNDDLLIVLSDHGFASFRRCFNLNTWLIKEGYMTLKEGAKFGSDYLQDVDWSKTRAYGLGLAGFYINRAGRERNGIVPDNEFESLKAEIAAKLEQVRDPVGESVVISKVYDSLKSYRGLYTEEAPDLIVGYAPGYRVSWESVTGGIEQEVFSDNVKAWSGDHHVDPKLVPGILFSNRPIKSEAPSILDLAPTVLDVFAIKPPTYMEGRVII